MTDLDPDRIERDGTDRERALVAALREARADTARVRKLAAEDSTAERTKRVAAEAEAAAQAATINYIQADLLAARAEADKLYCQKCGAVSECGSAACGPWRKASDMIAVLVAQRDRLSDVDAKLRATLSEIAGYTSIEWERKTALAALEAK